MESWGVIFDMDGVLVDSAAAHQESWRRLGQQQGRPFDAELFAHTFGMHNAQIIPMWLGREVDGDTARSLADWKESCYRELVPEMMQPIAGAVDLVRRLHQAGVPLAVGSSGPLPNLQLCLRSLGIEECFSAISSGDDVKHGKPDPEVFLVAARRLGLPRERCLVIEDAPAGIEAARRAGMAVLAISSSRPAAELAADRVVDSFLNPMLTAQELLGLVLRSSGQTGQTANLPAPG